MKKTLTILTLLALSWMSAHASYQSDANILMKTAVSDGMMEGCSVFNARMHNDDIVIRLYCDDYYIRDLTLDVDTMQYTREVVGQSFYLLDL